MRAKKRVQLRAWTYSAFCDGQKTIYTRDDATEDEVSAHLEQRHAGGNWDKSSLRRGRRLKVRPGQETVL